MKTIIHGLTATFITSIFLSAPVSANTQLPPIVNEYPACDYKIIDTVIRSHSLPPRPDNLDVEEAFQRLLPLLREDAQKRGADSLALTEKKVKVSQSNSSRLIVSAQLIKSCKETADVASRALTPLSSEGKQQFGFSNSISLKYKYEFVIPAKTRKPALPSSTLVSPETGIYGIALNSSMDTVLAQFGTPTFMFSPYPEWNILSYGRDHWLTFHNKTLMKISSASDLFNYSFLNHVPFDDRFDERKWHVADQIGKDDVVSDEQYTRLSGYRDKDTILELSTEEYLKNNQEYRSVVLTGFSLATENFSLPDNFFKALIDNNNAVLSSVAAHLADDKKAITVDMLSQRAFGITQEVRGRRFQLYDAFTLIETSGDAIYKIHVDPDYLSPLSSDYRHWQFNSFYYGQPVEDALRVAGEDAEHFGDSIVIEHDNYSLKLLTYGFAEEEHIYAMELFLLL